MYKVYNAKLEKLATQELVTIAEQSLFFQLLMIRAIPTLIMKLNIYAVDYRIKRDNYAKLISKLGDNAHNLPSHIKQKNREGLIAEVVCIERFLSEIQGNKELIKELNASQLIKLYKDNGLLN